MTELEFLVVLVPSFVACSLFGALLAGYFCEREEEVCCEEDAQN